MHGGDIYTHEVHLDFSVNLNPLGMPEEVRRAIRESDQQAQQYPDPEYRLLRRELGRRYGVNPERIVCGNGASELIMAVCRAVLCGKGVPSIIPQDTQLQDRQRTVLLCEPGFTGYRRALHAVCADVRTYLLREEEDYVPGGGLEEMIRQEQPALVLLANPSNPSGVLLPGERMRRLAKACRETGTVLCVDECFLELTGQQDSCSMIPYCRDDVNVDGEGPYDRLIVLNAITKTYAAPGVRLGYAFCGSEKMADRLKAQLPEWNVSCTAQAAGMAACHMPADYLTRSAALIREEREYLTGALASVAGVRVISSAANYILFHNGADLYHPLLEKGILIRDCSDYTGLGPGWYRIAVRQREKNRQLVEAIRGLT